MKPRYWLYIGFAVWLAETWYFGWNDEPCCRAEKIWDMVAVGFWLVGAFEYTMVRIAMAVTDGINEAKEAEK